MSFGIRFSCILLGVGLLAFALPPGAADLYAGGATFVARDGAGTVADDGAVTCRDGSGVGGVCIPFTAGGDSILVNDVGLGAAVAFQVCIDNDGDGTCGSLPAAVPGCEDDITFSHSDDGSFSNPLRAPATSIRTGCPGGFPGWVVLLCNGVHVDTSGPHAHTATVGDVISTTNGGPSGNFCGEGGAGGTNNTTALGKPYSYVGPVSVGPVCVSTLLCAEARV